MSEENKFDQERFDRSVIFMGGNVHAFDDRSVPGKMYYCDSPIDLKSIRPGKFIVVRADDRIGLAYPEWWEAL